MQIERHVVVVDLGQCHAGGGCTNLSRGELIDDAPADDAVRFHGLVVIAGHAVVGIDALLALEGDDALAVQSITLPWVLSLTRQRPETG